MFGWIPKPCTVLSLPNGKENLIFGPETYQPHTSDSISLLRRSMWVSVVFVCSAWANPLAPILWITLPPMYTELYLKEI